MKKLVLFFVLSLSLTIGYGQIRGIDFSSAIILESDNIYSYEKLTKLNNGYVIPFQLTPVGLKHCIERFGTLMSDNNLTEENSFKLDILLADYVDGITDFGSLCTSLRAGSSEVNLIWDKNGWRIAMHLNGDLVGIFLIKMSPVL